MKGKCALITGSTSGLGAAAAARLAAAGCNIVLNGLGEPDAIEAQRRAHGRVQRAGVAHLAHADG